MRATKKQVGTAAHGHPQPQRSRQCVVGLLGRNRKSDGEGKTLKSRRRAVRALVRVPVMTGHEITARSWRPPSDRRPSGKRRRRRCPALCPYSNDEQLDTRAVLHTRGYRHIFDNSMNTSGGLNPCIVASHYRELYVEKQKRVKLLGADERARVGASAPSVTEDWRTPERLSIVLGRDRDDRALMLAARKKMQCCGIGTRVDGQAPKCCGL
ncbi:hypothetical protein EVAR_52440_1 [Eumeta japonica]|uniref:Uncharacterized protein n=1 Tax=Eumeta variegata TaxID=151549 RepID=A0A4C1YQS8_EUMVA|nr:hypothetical protein EVAR_52440_1 [Eumeta japonica]